jgi:hypothetical protein
MAFVGALMRRTISIFLEKKNARDSLIAVGEGEVARGCDPITGPLVGRD